MKKIAILLTFISLCILLGGCKSSDYKKAQTLFDEGDYDNSIEMFSELGNYEDSSQYLSLAQKEQYVLTAISFALVCDEVMRRRNIYAIVNHMNRAPTSGNYVRCSILVKPYQ
ncbi:MAG: hypothetical protein Q4E99_06100 [Bacillota bacterium]|nr:hypothetical protein [Bacillota bacterium]